MPNVDLFRESSDEFVQFLNIAREKGISPNILLEEKLKPFQKKISQKEGELLAAITRKFDSTSSSTLPRRYQHYTITETLYVGEIAQNTRLLNPSEEDFCLKTAFIENVKNPCKKRDIGDLFSKHNSNSFESSSAPITPTSLYFFDRPQSVPKDADETTLRLFQLFPQASRLEIYIGNAEVLTFLEFLYGYQFMQLSRLLERSLPITAAMAKKVETEQISLYQKIVDIEKAASSSEAIFQKRLEAVRTSGGVICHPTHAEFTDEEVERLNYNVYCDEKFSKVLSLVQTAALRLQKCSFCTLLVLTGRKKRHF